MEDESHEGQEDADEEVAIEVTPAIDEGIYVSVDDLLADGYVFEEDDSDYVA